MYLYNTEKKRLMGNWLGMSPIVLQIKRSDARHYLYLVWMHRNK